jgi:hypothetical protein
MEDVQLDALRAGVEITTQQRRRGGAKRTRRTLPCGVERVPLARSPSGKGLVITLREGRNRQIRKMVGSFGHRVALLRRIAVGPVTLAGLAGPGSVAAVSETELRDLHSSATGTDDPSPSSPALCPASVGSELNDAPSTPVLPWRQRLRDEATPRKPCHSRVRWRRE